MIAREFYDWPAAAPPNQLYDRCSPNLLQLRTVMSQKYGLTSLGCQGVRSVRLGIKPSTHSWGAAIDLSYGDTPRSVLVDDILPWLVAWSAEWNVQAIHDYVGCRIWRAGRTARESDACDRWWKAQRPDLAGMGKTWATWIHVEVTRAGWPDSRSAVARGVS